MARYTGPRTRIARKFGEPIFGPDKHVERKNFPPGQHGMNKKRKKTSEYGVQLREKQKAKYTYGMLERQFRNTFEKASRTKVLQERYFFSFSNHVSTMLYIVWVLLLQEQLHVSWFHTDTSQLMVKS